MNEQHHNNSRRNNGKKEKNSSEKTKDRKIRKKPIRTIKNENLLAIFPPIHKKPQHNSNRFYWILAGLGALWTRNFTYDACEPPPNKTSVVRPIYRTRRQNFTNTNTRKYLSYNVHDTAKLRRAFPAQRSNT